VSGDATNERGRLIPVFVPALVTLLTRAEKDRGRPLSEAEVIEIRDNGNCIMGPKSAAVAVDQGRGYNDIDPEHVWEHWQAIRADIMDA
jgi:hypothetical protein